MRLYHMSLASTANQTHTHKLCMKDFGGQECWKTGTEKSIHDFLICSCNCKYYTKSITHNYSSFLNILVGAEWNSNSLLGGLLSVQIFGS